MPDFKDTFGGGLIGQAASGVIGTAMGLALEKHNDRRQIKQQQKLQDMQIAGSKQMSDYNYQKQLQMWKDTNYGAQMEELKKAGLNPGLIYGMSGGGGVTTGSGGGQVSGGQAASVSGETGMGIQMALQAQMQQAQIELAKSQANKNNVEAAKTAGVDTEEVKTKILSLNQGIQNQKAQEAMTKVQTRIAKLEEEVKMRSLDAVVQKLHYEADIAFQNTKILTNDALISDETKQTKIDTIKQSYINLVLQGLYLDASRKNVQQDTKLKASNIQVNDQTISKMSQEIMQGWDKLSIEQKKIKLQEILTNWNTDLNRELKNDIMNLFGKIMGGGDTYRDYHYYPNQ